MEYELLAFIVIGNAVLLVFVAGIILFILQYRKRKMIHEQEKKELNNIHEEEILRLQLEVKQQTMQQIGREIHDCVGQKLTLASLYIQQLTFENNTSWAITHKMETISTIINDSLHELRRLSRSLTDNLIDQNDLASLIEMECSKLKVLQQNVLSEVSAPFDLNYKAKNILIRIVQEFTQNSIRHSGCTTIEIRFWCAENILHLHLSDNGTGFDVSLIRNGIGLANMRKRIELLEGNCELESQIGKGTQLLAYIPFKSVKKMKT